MIDYCLQMKDEAAFNSVMSGCGLIDADGEPVSDEVLIDRIGPIIIWDYSAQPPASIATPPVKPQPKIIYPEYYANVRFLLEPTEAQATALAPFAIDPSQPQYRVWA